MAAKYYYVGSQEYTLDKVPVHDQLPLEIQAQSEVLKLAAVPAVLGLASFRVYFSATEKSDKISPREFSIYSAGPPVTRYVEEKRGHLETGLGLVRLGLRPYVRAVQNSYISVKTGAVSLYQGGQDTYSFLRHPPPGFLPRVGLITVSGLAGVVLARKGSRLKRIGLPVVLTSASAAVCYPTQAVSVLKLTAEKVYATSSLVASALKSKPRADAFEPAATLEAAPSCLEVEAPPSEAPLDSTPPTPGLEIIPAPTQTDAVAPVPASETGVSPFVDVVQAETAFGGVAPVVELPAGPAVDPFLDVSLVDDLAPEVVDTTRQVSELYLEENSPVSKDTPIEEAPAAVDVSPGDTFVTTPFDVPMETVTSASAPVVDVPPVPPPTKAVPQVAPEVDENALAEGAAPQRPLSPSAREAKAFPPITEKQQFVPDPSLADHGQAHPEDADMYSTRG